MVKKLLCAFLCGVWKNLGNVTAVVALVFGVWQFTVTQDLAQANLAADRELKAVDLFLKYSEIQQEISAAKASKAKGYPWQGDRLATLTEALYHLAGDDPRWFELVVGMVQDQEEYMRKTARPGTFSKDFGELVKQVLEIR